MYSRIDAADLDDFANVVDDNEKVASYSLLSSSGLDTGANLITYEGSSSTYLNDGDTLGTFTFWLADGIEYKDITPAAFSLVPTSSISGGLEIDTFPGG